MPGDDELLDKLQRNTFKYFEYEANSTNGLITDCTKEASYASIAAVGLALTAYPVAVERAFLTRDHAIQRTLATLRFLWNSPQGTGLDATGYKGFYYHFLDMQTGRRAGKCELSTVDTAILLAGVLTVAGYFDGVTAEEDEIRHLADELYRRVDWQWALNGNRALTHGWNPESGFIGYHWKDFSEALLLYLLGLGSPIHPLPAESYQAFTSEYRRHWKEIYEYKVLYAGSLFIHQLPHIWVDFRGLQDEFMRSKGMDYFENSRRATYIQREYAIRNPLRFRLYSENCWGFTASNGPGPDVRQVDGIDRHFYGYEQRGAPFGPDDGTVAPWAAAASLPFAPEIVLPAIRYFAALDVSAVYGKGYGFRATYNATYQLDDEIVDDLAERNQESIWVSPWYFGLNQGPVVLMIENYRTALIWRILQRCPYLQEGLRQAGFRGGWLDSSS